MNETISERVKRTVADVLGLAAADVSADSSSQSLEGWDSINHLNLVLALEQEFGVSIGPDEVFELTSIPAIAAFVQAKTA